MSYESLIKQLNENHDIPVGNEELVMNQIKAQMNSVKPYKGFDGECIRKISINCRIGNVIITDQFEWDINNPDNSPEDFAAVIVTDLGLSSEFLLPIAHQI